MQPRYSGKVRELYDISDTQMVIVTTDRISAFDHILPTPVCGKGRVLNQLSNFWFGRTQHIIPNHIVDSRTENMPPFFHDDFFQGRCVLVKKLKMLPFEFVVRGYLFGKMWEAYKNKECFCNISLPAGYSLAQKLARPVLTPAIKHPVGHDEYVDMCQVEKELGVETTQYITKICFKLYLECSSYALSKGVIIADAKFEFGYDEKGVLLLADEIFTPDASRYWDADKYRVGISPASFDKQFLRDWLLQHQENGAFPFDQVPKDVLLRTGQLYQTCLHRLIGP